MKTCYYYSLNVSKDFGGINACSIASDEYPITVNCAGRIATSDPFVTDNPEGRNDYYLMYIECGELEFEINGRPIIAQSGYAVIFPPYCHYKYTYRGDSELSYLWAHFTGSYTERFLAESGFKKLPCIIQSNPNIKIISYFEKLFNIFSLHEPLQKQRLACQLESILLTLALTSNDTFSSRCLTKSLGYIHTSYNKEIRIPELAKMESLSNSRYITVFKETMGMSPSEYILNLRINVACDLLRNHDMSVKEVAVSIGYDNAHFFSKIFKKKTGTTPKKYKEGNP